MTATPATAAKKRVRGPGKKKAIHVHLDAYEKSMGLHQDDDLEMRRRLLTYENFKRAGEILSMKDAAAFFGFSEKTFHKELAERPFLKEAFYMGRAYTSARARGKLVELLESDDESIALKAAMGLEHLRLRSQSMEAQTKEPEQKRNTVEDFKAMAQRLVNRVSESQPDPQKRIVVDMDKLDDISDAVLLEEMKRIPT